MAAFLKKWVDEKPLPLKRICVIDKDGKRDGHLNPLVWDGEHLRKKLCDRLNVDENNLDEWCYYDELS